jgi:hypothetical protein
MILLLRMSQLTRVGILPAEGTVFTDMVLAEIGMNQNRA